MIHLLVIKVLKLTSGVSNMQGEMYSPEGEELAIGPISGVPDSREAGASTLFMIIGTNITDKDIPYVLYWDYDSGKVARVSIVESKYLESDIKIPDDNIEIFNNFMHENWDGVLHNFDHFMNGMYHKHKRLPENLQCPDYSTLNCN